MVWSWAAASPAARIHTQPVIAQIARMNTLPTRIRAGIPPGVTVVRRLDGRRSGIHALLQRLREKQIVIPGRLDSSAADRQGDLGPVPGLVQQAMKEQLARGQRKLAALDRDLPWFVRRVVVQLRRELLELAADRGAVVEQRR